jgi:hypothetical protein
VEYCLCRKEDRPDLKSADISDVPRTFIFDCAFGGRAHCGVYNKDGDFLRHYLLAWCHKKLKVMVWEDVDRSGGKKQLELTQTQVLVCDLDQQQLISESGKLISHVAKIQWTHQKIELDISLLRKDTVLIFADFEA